MVTQPCVKLSDLVPVLNQIPSGSH